MIAEKSKLFFSFLLAESATLASCHNAHAAAHTCCNACHAHGQ